MPFDAEIPMNMLAPLVRPAGPEIATALKCARAGDTDWFRKALRTGLDPNAADEDGWTPLMGAAARAHPALVAILVAAGADPRLAHPRSGALPVHLAAQAGDIATVSSLLDAAPDTLDAVCDINGHTPLLQAVSYGHTSLAEHLARRGADTAVTTARGLGPLELAAHLQNDGMVAILAPFDSSRSQKTAAYADYLRRIATPIASGDEHTQALSDAMIATIEQGLKETAHDASAATETLAALMTMVERGGADVNRLGGPLRQPPLVAAATGSDGFPQNPDVARLRLDLSAYLLERGADPIRREKHPLGVQSITRAAMSGHLPILKLMAGYCSAGVYTDAINDGPVVDGLTAMHHSVLRAATAVPEHARIALAQIRWFVEHGGRSDIEDFSGATPWTLAERAADPKTRAEILAILDGRG